MLEQIKSRFQIIVIHNDNEAGQAMPLTPVMIIIFYQSFYHKITFWPLEVIFWKFYNEQIPFTIFPTEKRSLMTDPDQWLISET